MKSKIKPVSNWLLTLVLSIYFGLVLNIPIYNHLADIFAQLDRVDIGFIISIPFFFILVLNVLFNLFSWPYWIKPFFVILIITSSLVSYATYSYHTIFDREMIENVFETNLNEASSYYSSSAIIWFLVLGILPSLLLTLVRIKQERSTLILIGKKLLSIALSLLGVLAIAALYYQNYVSVGRNNSELKRMIVPTYFINGLAGYLHDNYFSTPIPYQHIGLDAEQNPIAFGAKPAAKPTLFFMLVGETARANNYRYHGYHRDTNPYTKPYDLFYFQHVVTCGTSTAVSVPCMFSIQTREEFNRKQSDNQDNALDILKRAGISLLWKDNDGGDKNVAKNIPVIEVDSNKQDINCNGQSCLDSELLNNIDNEIRDMKGNRMIILHLMGSHGPTYFQRYPKDMSYFEPDCERADIENCSNEALVNTYDNSIRYTDFFIASLIKKLSLLEGEYNTALLYLSDHGESLGEDGLYLHGMIYSLAPEYQTRVPMILWMSPGYQAMKNINTGCLKQQAKQAIVSQDFIFHTLLSAMNVKTKVYNEKYDLFSLCRK